MCRDIFYLRPSEGGLVMPRVEIRQYTLRIAFLDRVCSDSDGEGGFWMEDSPKNFPSPRSVHSFTLRRVPLLSAMLDCSQAPLGER